MIVKVLFKPKDAMEILKDIDNAFIEKHLTYDKSTKRKTFEKYNKFQWIIDGNCDPSKSDEVVAWPDYSELPCWNCTRYFTKAPISLPNYYDCTKKCYSTIGVFCSFGCAARWYFEHEHKDSDLLNELFYKCGGKGTIKKAPQKEVLIKFGGNLSDEEYENIVNSDIFDVFLGFPPMQVMTPIINLHQTIPRRKEDEIASIFLASKGVSKYRLYRNKKPVL